MSEYVVLSPEIAYQKAEAGIKNVKAYAGVTAVNVVSSVFVEYESLNQFPVNTLSLNSVLAVDSEKGLQDTLYLESSVGVDIFKTITDSLSIQDAISVEKVADIIINDHLNVIDTTYSGTKHTLNSFSLGGIPINGGLLPNVTIKLSTGRHDLNGSAINTSSLN